MEKFFNALKSVKLIWVKVIIFILTVALSIVSFGVYSNFQTDPQKLFDSMLKTTDNVYLHAVKTYKGELSSYENGKLVGAESVVRDTVMHELELDQYANSLSTTALGVVSLQSSFETRISGDGYYMPNVKGISYLPPYNPLGDKVVGALPNADDELVITFYTAETLIKHKVYNAEGQLIDAKNTDELIGQSVKVYGEVFKIVGILDDGGIPAKFDDVRSGNADAELLKEFDDYMADSYHNVVIMKRSKMNAFAGAKVRGDEGYTNYTYAKIGIKKDGEYAYENDWQATNYTSSVSQLIDTYIISGSRDIESGKLGLPVSLFCDIAEDFLVDIVVEANARGDVDALAVANSYRVLLDGVRTGKGFFFDENGLVNVGDLSFESVSLNMDEILSYLLANGMSTTFEITPYEVKTGKTVGTPIVVELSRVIFIEGDTLYLSKADADALWAGQKASLSSYMELNSKYASNMRGVYDYVLMPFEYDESFVEYFYGMYKNEEFLSDDSLMTIRGSFLEYYEQTLANNVTASKMMLVFAIAITVVSVVYPGFAIFSPTFKAMKESDKEEETIADEQ